LDHLPKDAPEKSLRLQQRKKEIIVSCFYFFRALSLSECLLTPLQFQILLRLELSEFLVSSGNGVSGTSDSTTTTTTTAASIRGVMIELLDFFSDLAFCLSDTTVALELRNFLRTLRERSVVFFSLFSPRQHAEQLRPEVVQMSDILQLQR
jgi:hypothetical protein